MTAARMADETVYDLRAAADLMERVPDLDPWDAVDLHLFGIRFFTHHEIGTDGDLWARSMNCTGAIEIFHDWNRRQSRGPYGGPYVCRRAADLLEADPWYWKKEPA